MASIRDLRTRIRSVGNIKQITRAMEMVATTKLRRYQDRAIASRPYTIEIEHLLGNLAQAWPEQVAARPSFNFGAGTATAVLVITSDRGLCGAYNSQLFAALERWLAAENRPDVRFFVYGRKGFQYLTKRGRKVERFFADPPLESVDFRLAKFTATALWEAFTSGAYRDVFVYYTAFESVARYVPTVFQLLPVQAAPPADEKEASAGNVIVEPGGVEVLDLLIPRYVITRVYNAMLEAITSEYASRRTSMKNATDAATDMQNVLRGIYNRKRQENITKELLDIVGGAEALRG